MNGLPRSPRPTRAITAAERAAFAAEQETELLHFGLPDLRGLESRPAYTAEAAE